jgi:hypothetical protein
VLNGGAGASSILGPALADTYALMHDPVQGAHYMAASDPEDSITGTLPWPLDCPMFCISAELVQRALLKSLVFLHQA